MNKTRLVVYGGLLSLLIAVGLAWRHFGSPYRNTDYIPSDLTDSHKALQAQLSSEDLELIRAMKSEDETVELHHGLGRWLRNAWLYPNGSRLSTYFNTLGIQHTDDMSAIILDTFWCKLHGQPFRLEERVKFYQDYWKNPENTVMPNKSLQRTLPSQHRAGQRR